MRRVALITGASRGIGAATAVVLAQRGFRVVVNHRASAPQAEEVVRPSPRLAARPWRFRPMSPNPMTSPHGGRNRRAVGRRGRARSQRAHPFRHHLVRRADLGAARRQAGPRAARRIPDDESRRAGDDFPQLRPAGLSQHGAVPPAPRRHDHAGHRQGGAGPVRPVRRTRAGAARDHREPRRARHGGRIRR